MNDPVEGIRVQYKPVECKKPEGDSICKEVGIKGEEVEFQVTVTLQSCPEQSQWDKTKE